MKLEEYLNGVPEEMTKLAAMPDWLRRVGKHISDHAWSYGVGAGAGAGGLAAGLAAHGAGTPPAAPELPEDVPLGNAPYVDPSFWRGVANKALGTAFGAGAVGLGALAYKGLRRGGQQHIHPSILQNAVASDELLQGADPQALQMHFATMARFAPTLATDPSAVQSFLREAVTSGGGINYNTIKLLTEAERIAQEIA